MEASFSGEFLSTASLPRPSSAPNLSGPATPPDGGPPLTSDQVWPVQGHTTFREFLHALNPLQHLPVIGMIYRAITGDTIQPAYRVAGAMVTGLLMGGPIGVIGTAIGCLAEDMWNRGLNQPVGLMPLTYSAGAEAAIPAQVAMLPASTPPATAFAQAESPEQAPSGQPTSLAPAVSNRADSISSVVEAGVPISVVPRMQAGAQDWPAGATFDNSNSPELARRVEAAIAAYGKSASVAPASSWAMAGIWLPTVAG